MKQEEEKARVYEALRELTSQSENSSFFSQYKILEYLREKIRKKEKVAWISGTGGRYKAISDLEKRPKSRDVSHKPTVIDVTDSMPMKKNMRGILEELVKGKKAVSITLMNAGLPIYRGYRSV